MKRSPRTPTAKCVALLPLGAAAANTSEPRIPPRTHTDPKLNAGKLSSAEIECKQLLDRMKASVHFKQTESSSLLDTLWTHRAEQMRDTDLEVLHYGNKAPLETIDGGRSRVAIGDLRKRAILYAREWKTEKWTLEVPKVRGGYQLRFVLTLRPTCASQCFWNAHRGQTQNPVLISGSHLFFFDTHENKIIRYANFNDHKRLSKKALLTKLKRRFPQCETEHLEPWNDVYLASGDIEAHEALARWFQAQDGTRVKRLTCRQITESEVHRRNAILIGRPQTNPLIKTIMDAEPQRTKFAFRIHAKRGAISVSNMSERELEPLRRFPFANPTTLGPLLGESRVFGVVTRLPNPAGHGHITIIACGHYAMVISRIVEALTDDANAASLLQSMGLPADEAMPESFEMLFTVNLSPGGLEGEGFPKLVMWRPL